MRSIALILLLLLANNLFAQNKHSELYNKIKSISKILLNREIDSFTYNKPVIADTLAKNVRHTLTCELTFNTDTLPPLLLINDQYSEYNALDSLSEKSIYSIEVINGNGPATTALYGAKGLNGVISIKTTDYYYSSIKKKKHK
ncbi:MAG: hypothetical protein U0U67_11500 [Chitinophagales bacterium]